MDDPRHHPAGELRSHHDFPSQALGNRRTLAVYLPPGYGARPKRRYPVLYLHDGQNLFDPADAAPGVTWDAHTTAERLICAGRIPPVILVGVHSTADRVEEYTPFPDPGERAGGRGGLYARFLADEVKPFIDGQYRTRPGREHTGVAGSSLGALASLTVVREHHAHFGLCGLLSPSLWWGRARVLRELERDPGWLRGVRFWVDMGLREGGRGSGYPRGVTHTRRLVRAFDAAGLVRGRDYAYHEVPGGEHNEAAWAARFDRVLLFFFG
jgi:predicted alpha/beta superfamily hydrolase